MWKIYFRLKYMQNVENLLSIEVYNAECGKYFRLKYHAECGKSSVDSYAECGKSTFDSSIYRCGQSTFNLKITGILTNLFHADS